jgi:uncharacterized protein YndB with AHSA1/START domain
MTGDVPGGPIHWRLHLPVAPGVVFDMLATDAGRARFWAESSHQTGATIEFQFVDGTITRGRIVEQQPVSSFALEYFGGVARFALTPDGDGGTDLRLTHTGVPDAEWQDVHAGWLNVLFPLKAWLCGGVDLRNHDPRRTWTQGYADQ